MRTRVVAASIVGSLFLTALNAEADKVCLKVKANRSLLTRTVASSANCPKGYTAVINTALLVGPAGATGPTGAAGVATS